MIISDWLRHCAICGVYSPPIDYCCTRCWTQRIYKHISVGHLQITPEKIPVWYLFLWKQQKQLTKFIYDFKYSGLQSAGDHLMELLIGELLVLQGWVMPDYIVYPTKKDSHRDHAYLLANSVSKLTGAKLIPLKLKEEMEAYRGLSRSQRHLRRRFKRGPDILEMGLGESVLFVDDVMTTGATIVAAKKALKVKQLRVVVVAYKNPG